VSGNVRQVSKVRQPSRAGSFLCQTGVEDERSSCYQLPEFPRKCLAMGFLLNGKWKLSVYLHQTDRETRGREPSMVLQVEIGHKGASK
jgi:hypothetical protein